MSVLCASSPVHARALSSVRWRRTNAFLPVDPVQARESCPRATLRRTHPSRGARLAIWTESSSEFNFFLLHRKPAARFLANASRDKTEAVLHCHLNGGGGEYCVCTRRRLPFSFGSLGVGLAGASACLPVLIRCLYRWSGGFSDVPTAVATTRRRGRRGRSERATTGAGDASGARPTSRAGTGGRDNLARTVSPDQARRPAVSKQQRWRWSWQFGSHGVCVVVLHVFGDRASVAGQTVTIPLPAAGDGGGPPAQQLQAARIVRL